MYQFYSYSELLSNLFGKILRAINRAVLAACAAETHHQVFESAPQVGLNGGLNNLDGFGQKIVDGSVCFQEIDDWLVAACE